MNIKSEILTILDETLHLGGRAASFDDDTPLLGALPELDSMAALNVIALLEERFGFVDNEHRIDAATFETLGHLVAFVRSRIDS